jgi:hypothetical protein
MKEKKHIITVSWGGGHIAAALGEYSALVILTKIWLSRSA